MAEILPLNRAPLERLQSALRLLAVSQDAQRAAMNNFRESLYELRDSTAKLQASVQGWHRRVGDTGRELAKAQDAVRTLGDTAARM
ncbi:hypothetical protein [Roseomonas populi]|uniref:Phage tail tape measure protein n=1 Tax=Roseomonas populi TaxID=3121582 RepID=A0ABT1WZP1_9PROT|nr:hypothetical protein [Roseomonas pecuniae]MCR0981311.1 hypothetical protein [Roseomonas pecuniae]